MLAGEQLIVGQLDGVLLRLALDGSVLWRTRLGDSIVKAAGGRRARGCHRYDEADRTRRGEEMRRRTIVTTIIVVLAAASAGGNARSARVNRIQGPGGGRPEIVDTGTAPVFTRRRTAAARPGSADGVPLSVAKWGSGLTAVAAVYGLSASLEADGLLRPDLGDLCSGSGAGARCFRKVATRMRVASLDRDANALDERFAGASWPRRSAWRLRWRCSSSTWC